MNVGRSRKLDELSGKHLSADEALTEGETYFAEHIERLREQRAEQVASTLATGKVGSGEPDRGGRILAVVTALPVVIGQFT